MNIGFIGLGNMGAGMANNLLNHCNNSNDKLFVLDLNETVLSDFEARGALNGESASKMCPQCDVLFTSLPSSKEVNLKNIASMTEVNLDTLKANRVISQATKKVKIFGICEISQPMIVTGILVTKGAKESIEKAGGTVAPIETKPIKEKFVKTSKKIDEKTSEKIEESPE